MDYDVIIVGAGASGLISAIAAARKGSKVLVIEQKEKAGKKILATGNGKCNFSNLYQAEDCYRSNDSTFAMKVLSCFDIEKTLEFFQELGIYPKERNGYLYPNSEQAASVVQVLLMECERFRVSFSYEEKVIEIRKPYFTVITQVLNPAKQSINRSASHKNYHSKKLILATGGCASPKLGSDGSGYLLAKNFGHTIIKPLPALVQLKSSAKYLKAISGVRTIAKLSLNSDNACLGTEEGEIIFTDYGISGIPVMQLSRFAAKVLNQKQKVHFIIDFLPELSCEELIQMLKKRIAFHCEKTLEQLLIGILNHKLTYILIKESLLDPVKISKNLSEVELNTLVKQIKAFSMNITDTNSFDHAQVSAGGISTKELYETTMESKLIKNLYFTGELVDVDGTCGGYNLQWAWSSGYVAGSAAGE